MTFRVTILQSTMHIRHNAGPIRRNTAWWRCKALTVWILLASAFCRAGEKAKPFHPQFDRDIRPILAENCYPCHGPDQNKRKAKLRLDQKDDALKALPNGDFAIVSGDPLRSK